MLFVKTWPPLSINDWSLIGAVTTHLSKAVNHGVRYVVTNFLDHHKFFPGHATLLVPQPGIEPGRAFRSRDFKSRVSTYSTTTAYLFWYTRRLLRVWTLVLFSPADGLYPNRLPILAWKESLRTNCFHHTLVVYPRWPLVFVSVPCLHPLMTQGIFTLLDIVKGMYSYDLITVTQWTTHNLSVFFYHISSTLWPQTEHSITIQPGASPGSVFSYTDIGRFCRSLPGVNLEVWPHLSHLIVKLMLPSFVLPKGFEPKTYRL